MRKKIDALPIFLLSKMFSLFWIVKIERKAKKEEEIELKTTDGCKDTSAYYIFFLDVFGSMRENVNKMALCPNFFIMRICITEN